jgi:hypothetical protein
MQEMNERKYEHRISYGLQELAKMIGVSRGFLRLEVKRGNLKPRNLGRRVVVTRTEVKRYLGEEVL